MEIRIKKITYKFDTSVTGNEIIEKHFMNLKNNIVALKIDNSRIIDLQDKIDKTCEIKFITLNDKDALSIIRHSTAHILAQAVKRLFKDTKIAIGPSIENGFYYDFDPVDSFSMADVEKIEQEMKKIIEEKSHFVKKNVSKKEAVEIFGKNNEIYKLELIKGLKNNITIYTQKDFVDLCAGPHVPHTGFIKAFKLDKLAGAYWRGNTDNKMLQRIYGFAFNNRKDLQQYLNFLEEAKKRDHRKLGKELSLFMMSEYAPGFTFYLPNGLFIKNKLEEIWRHEHKISNYQEVSTPILNSKSLWEKSGHWDNYKENMYITSIENDDYAIKPMNCPGAMLIYKNSIRSYKELPLRICELGVVHRHELSGVLHGLMRVREFTQDDAHIFMTKDQIESEIISVIEMIDKFYSKIFDFNYSIKLSTKPKKAIGSDEIWETATQGLKNALDNQGLEYEINEGDGAFYGPKIDFIIKDSLNREWQCSTIQLDFNLPERFDLNYIDNDGQKQRPVIIHRVIYGSLERFIAILIEHYKGAFPVWLAPIQCIILTITDKEMDYAAKLKKELEALNIRVNCDLRNEKIGMKIREANLNKIPYQIIIGEKEVENNKINLREYGNKNSKLISLDELINMIK